MKAQHCGSQLSALLGGELLDERGGMRLGGRQQ